MADYVKFIKTTQTMVYSLELPSNWMEVQRASDAIGMELNKYGLTGYDDTVTVSLSDTDELLFSFEIPDEKVV
jgi:hypothetical protein